LNTTVSTLLGERSGQRTRVGNIQQYIDSLRHIDEQLEEIITHRQEMETDFQACFQQTYILDKDCRYLFASILGAQTIGLMPADIVGRHWRDLGQLSEFAQTFEQQVMSVFFTEKPLTAEMILPAPNGISYCEYRLKPLINENGSVEAVMVSLRNTTTSKVAQLELANQISKRSQLIDMCPIGIITLDRCRIISVVNQRAQTLLSSHSAANWVGRDINELLERAGLSHVQAPLMRALQGETATLGHQAGWQISAFPLRDITGGIDGGIIFFQKNGDPGIRS
jgi:PAS domain-containing protein